MTEKVEKITDEPVKNCNWRKVDLFYVWNQDGDGVVDMWEDIAELRMREAYGGEVCGRKKVTLEVPVKLSDVVVKALIEIGYPGFGP